jgi:GH24 family phage-related lysozyme (muramidase)
MDVMKENWYERAKEAGILAQLGLTAALAAGGAGIPPGEATPATVVTQEAGPSFIPSQKFLETLERHEDFKPEIYRDSRNILSIGIGFNLERRNAANLLRAAGLDAEAVMSGRKHITREEAWRLAYADLETAIADAKRLFKNFDSLPMGVQEVLVNMSFNLGGSKLAEFKKMRAAVEAEDWEAAADEMENSRWRTQVKGRAVELVAQMRAGGDVVSSGEKQHEVEGEVGGDIVVVRQGQTLSGIAREHLGDPRRWVELARLNDIKDPDSIKPGQKVRIK